MTKFTIALLIGAAAGFASGMLGIGGGLVMVPLLVGVLSLTQHRAHATSLAAIVSIATLGALTFHSAGEVDVRMALLLAAGALAGAPIGAKLMSQTSEARLKVAFGVFMVVVGTVVVAT